MEPEAIKPDLPHDADRLLIRLLSFLPFPTPGWVVAFVKFCLVGLVNTLIDFTIYFTLTRQFAWFAVYYLLANVIAFFTANLFSFFANKHWTFANREHRSWSQYSKFLAISLVSLLGVELTLYIVVSLLESGDVVGKIVALAVSVLINFTGSKFWAFR